MVLPLEDIRSSSSSDDLDSDLDSCRSSPANYPPALVLALHALRDSVSLADRYYAWPFAKDIEREYEREKGDYASSFLPNSLTNVGVILEDGALPVGVSFVLVSMSISISVL